MAIQQGGNAPYAPAQAVIELLEGYRDRGFATPFTTDVLVRAGVADGLVNRVMQSLKLLDLIDETGHPTDQLEALKRERGEEAYKARLQEWLRAVYVEVLQFADPAVDSSDRVAEAFRGYSPAGQRSRMVTLMVGLFRYAGLISEPAKRLAAPRQAKRATTAKSNPRSEPVRSLRVYGGGSASAPDDEGLPPGLVGLLRQVPRGGRPWTKERRDNFLRAFEAVLDFSVPIGEEAPPPTFSDIFGSLARAGDPT